ncbi:hypothetical protein CU669_07100 [Paramagnetospirillum kuznetsovii]|uniref:Uncharacterized protein n=1 Tax=Paramagnetospirillum kuznetsovii TaxID=2053833 RepID=A0A364NZJ4_9PROT|nr:hypothetical protein CU669_07100 [Paramagnetospirillum kuznetsovii]
MTRPFQGIILLMIRICHDLIKTRFMLRDYSLDLYDHAFFVWFLGGKPLKRTKPQGFPWGFDGGRYKV